MELNQVTLPTTDVARAVAFYRRLGFKQIVDSEHYARFECSPGGSSFSIHLSDAPVPDHDVVIYFESDDVDEEIERLRKSGVTIDVDPVDQKWLWREAHLRDPDGNRICVYHAGKNRLNPPWRKK